MQAMRSRPSVFPRHTRHAAGEKSYDVNEIRRHHPAAYRRWTGAEDARLRFLHACGRSADEIAPELGRQPGSIRSRLQKVGLS
jgi:hypothetical protein